MQQSVLGAMDAIHNVLLELKPFCERCNSCIALVREVRPDVVTYNSLIHVLIKSDDPSAAGEQADKYLQELKNENIKPNAFVYTNTIKAWSKRRDRKAEERIKVLKSEVEQLEQEHLFEHERRLLWLLKLQ